VGNRFVALIESLFAFIRVNSRRNALFFFWRFVALAPMYLGSPPQFPITRLPDYPIADPQIRSLLVIRAAQSRGICFLSHPHGSGEFQVSADPTSSGLCAHRSERCARRRRRGYVAPCRSRIKETKTKPRLNMPVKRLVPFFGTDELSAQSRDAFLRESRVTERLWVL